METGLSIHQGHAGRTNFPAGARRTAMVDATRDSSRSTPVPTAFDGNRADFYGRSRRNVAGKAVEEVNQTWDAHLERCSMRTVEFSW